MKSRYAMLATYSLCLAAGAGIWLAVALRADAHFPPLWVIGVSILASLFVWHFGVQAPRVGLISMERVPQIGLLLVFSPAVAASICAAASFVWPMVSRRYSHGSVAFGALRGVHNASMTALMLLAAGQAYLALGGDHPLAALSSETVLALVAMALVAQAVNVVTMALFFRLDGRDIRRIITPSYALSDLIFVPAGVLAALLYNSGAHSALVLFLGLMVVFVLSFNSIGQSLNAADAERGPIAKLFDVGRVLHGARRIDELGERILSETRSLFGFDEFYFVLVDRDRQVLEVRVHERRAERLAGRTKPLDAGLFGWVVDTARSVLVEDWARM